MTLKTLLSDNVKILEKHKIEDARYDVTSILLNLLDMDMARFLCEEDDELENKYSVSAIRNLINELSELVNLRANGFPLQYILGETYFCGLRFSLDQSVLIPRADTEMLVEKVLSDNPITNVNVLDLCTGSGCIAIALASIGKYKTVVGTDISDEAISVASKNAEDILEENDIEEDDISQRIYFLKSDLFKKMYKIKEQLGVEKFDVITANPPYIKTGDIDNLQREVSAYEPRIALDGDEDGLKYYRQIAEGAKEYLCDDGKIYLEIGFDQANAVKDIFFNSGWEFVDLVKDLGGNDRVLVFSL